MHYGEEGSAAQRDILTRYAALTRSFDQMLKEHHKGTWSHQHLVAQIATHLCLEANLSVTDTLEVAYAAANHDIGKLCIDPQVLDSPILTPGGWEAITRHPAESCRLLEEGGAREDRILQLIRSHHLLQRRPYPQDELQPFWESTSKEPTMMLKTLIITVADKFAAMSEPRPYRALQYTQKAIQAYLLEEIRVPEQYAPCMRRLVAQTREAASSLRTEGIYRSLCRGNIALQSGHRR